MEEEGKERLPRKGSAGAKLKVQRTSEDSYSAGGLKTSEPTGGRRHSLKALPALPRRVRLLSRPQGAIK